MAPDYKIEERKKNEIGNPLILDKQHDAEIKNILERGLTAYIEVKPAFQRTTTEKLEALVHTMRDKEYFGIAYVVGPSPIPKTAEEVYVSKQGDCDDISRLYVALADRIGIPGLKQFYVNFKEKTTGMEDGHAAIFYIGDTMMYVDPSFERVFFFRSKYKTPEQAINDPEFGKKLLEFRAESIGKKGNWGVDEIGILKGTEGFEAMYYFEMGRSLANEGKWKEAIDNLHTSVKKGMKYSNVFFAMGEGYYYLNDYANAITYFKKANEIKKDNPANYSFLGYSYYELGEYENAINAFKTQIRLDPQGIEGFFGVGISCNNAAEELMKKKHYQKAIQFYDEAEKALNEVTRHAEGSMLEEAKRTLNNVKKRKTEAEQR